MITPEQDKIRVLMVNDEHAELEHYRDSIERHCPKNLDIRIFGPKQAGSIEVGRTLIGALLGKNPHISLDKDFDVFFVDLSMPDLNGFDFLRLLRETSGEIPNRIARLPVVLMTKYESQLLDGIDTGIEEGVSGYVFTNRERFWLDFEATTLRVFQEKEREKWAESLMTISTRLPNVVGKDNLCKMISDAVDEECPDLKVLVGEYDTESKIMSVLGVTDNLSTVAARKLGNTMVGHSIILNSVLAGQVHWYNSLEELKTKEIDENELSLYEELGLWRGLSLPLIDDESKVFGMVSMYRRMIDPPFTILERNYARLMVKQISETWTARRQRQQGIAYSLFLREFTSYSDEDELFKHLVEHLHEEIHKSKKADFQSKTTFKVLFPGSDKLVCQAGKGHHVGVERDHDYRPSVYNNRSVSAWVARENKPRVVADFSKEKDYATTHKGMRSELCLPISAGDDISDPVFGVINLECSDIGFYSYDALEYAKALCGLTGQIVYRLRINSFLHQIISALGDKSESEQLIRTSVSIIRRLTGYRLLVFVIRHENKWEVAHIDVAKPDADKVLIAKQLQSLLEGKEQRTLVQTAFAQDRPVYFVPNLQQLPDNSYYVPPTILDKDETIRSQAVFLMRYGENTVGGLSLDFVITNALSNEQQEILGHFARWLGRMIFQTSDYDYLREKVEGLYDMSAMADFLGVLWHKSVGELHTLRNLAEECINDPKVQSDSQLRKRLIQLAVGVEQIRGLPYHFKSLAGSPHLVNVDTKKLWDTARRSLSLKVQEVDAEIETSGEFPLVYCDQDILQMVMYHLLDNALDACRNAVSRKVILKGISRSDSEMELCLSDDGQVVPLEQLSKMGEVRYSTKPNGTGYGLIWVKVRVKDMNGKFYLRSKFPKPGLEASVILPVAKS